MVYIYCNIATLQVASHRGVKPIEVSKVLLTDTYLDYVVASFESLDELLAIEEGIWNGQSAWWREIGHSNINIEEEKGMYGTGYKPRIAREAGLLNYICDQYGASTEKNVAAILGDIAWYEGKNAIELFNSFNKL